MVVAGIFYNYSVSTQLSPRYPWLFKGAYSVYTAWGLMLFVPLNATIRIEVLDFNITHVKILHYFRGDSPLVSTNDSVTQWVDLNERKLPYYPDKLQKKSESDVYFRRLGMRHCTVYEYESTQSSPKSICNDRAVLYVDSKTSWFLKIKITNQYDFLFSRHTLELEFELTETNIPGLKVS